MVGAPFGFVVEVEVESSEPEPEIGIYVVVCLWSFRDNFQVYFSVGIVWYDHSKQLKYN